LSSPKNNLQSLCVNFHFFEKQIFSDIESQCTAKLFSYQHFSKIFYVLHKERKVHTGLERHEAE